MKRLRPIFDLIKETFQEWNADKAPRLAAALAYYTAFSIAPHVDYFDCNRQRGFLRRSGSRPIG